MLRKRKEIVVRGGIKFIKPFPILFISKCDCCKLLFHKKNGPHYWKQCKIIKNGLYDICMDSKNVDFIPLQYYKYLKKCYSRNKKE